MDTPRLLFAQATVIDARWSYPLRSPFWRLYLDDEDGAEVVHPGGVVPLLAGRAYLIPAWGSFQGRCHRRVAHHYLHFEPGAFLQQGAEAAGSFGKKLTRPIAVAPGSGVESRLRIAATTGLDSPRGGMHALAAVTVALADLIETLPRADIGVGGCAAEDPINRVLAAIEGFPDRHFDLQALARQTGWSSSHFVVRFRARTGYSPHAYILSRRVNWAAERLLASDEPIERVAEACGFANRHHFTRVFSARMGCGPASYRRGARP